MGNLQPNKRFLLRTRRTTYELKINCQNTRNWTERINVNIEINYVIINFENFPQIDHKLFTSPFIQCNVHH